jgi:serine/threonine protein phosphatase PrpC
MDTANFSLQGPRGDNQDATYIAILDSASVIAIVADGVGGLEGGRLASECVRQAGEDAVIRRDFNPEKIIVEAHKVINQLPIEKAATTASVVFCNKKNLVYAHTGDSRIYLIRGAGIKALTTDQTEAYLLVSEGVISKEEARTYRRRNVLIHAVEKGQELSLEVGNIELNVGDRVLLLTDGIHKLISKRRIKELSSISEKMIDFSNNIQAELDGALTDDASLVCFEI